MIGLGETRCDSTTHVSTTKHKTINWTDIPRGKNPVKHIFLCVFSFHNMMIEGFLSLIKEGLICIATKYLQST